MRFVTYRISYLLAFLFAFNACKQRSEVKAQAYKMISYESKAWVDEEDFPTINIFENGSFQIYKKGMLVFYGQTEFKADSLVFNVNNKTQLFGVYVDTGKTMLRISRLVNIDVEAKYGEFKEIKNN